MRVAWDCARNQTCWMCDRLALLLIRHAISVQHTRHGGTGTTQSKKKNDPSSRAEPIRSNRLDWWIDEIDLLNWTDSLHTSHTTFCLESIESIRFEAGWMTNRWTRRRSYCVRCVRCVNCALCVYCVLLVAMRKECSNSVPSLPGADWFGSKQASYQIKSFLSRKSENGWNETTLLYDYISNNVEVLVVHNCRGE